MSRERGILLRLRLRLHQEARLLRAARRSPSISLQKYWSAYGGRAALFRSPFFHVAVAVGFLCLPLVINWGDWAGKILGVVPNLLGFSLSGFAILLALGTEKFQRILAN